MYGLLRRKTVCAAIALLAVFAASIGVHALINPNFTPVHLVAQSDVILTLKVKDTNQKEIGATLELEVLSALKGKAPQTGILTVDLSKAPQDHAAIARGQVKEFIKEPILYFSATDETEKPAAFLHVHGLWLRLSAAKDGRLTLEGKDKQMPATWAGGTDMLSRCVQYILSDSASAYVPVDSGMNWASTAKIGSVTGKARDIAAVDLTLDGKVCLFVASDKGDHLFRGGKDGLQDITATVHLQSASCVAAWADFNGDGRTDLASYNGKTLTIWAQGSDGGFAPVKDTAVQLPEDCVALAVVGFGTSKLPALLASFASGQLIVLKPTVSNTFEQSTLAAAGSAPKECGKAQPCLVADFNGDSWPDIIQPFEKSGLIYFGNKRGEFDAPKPCNVRCTTGGGKPCIGDFDGDGLPDVLVAGTEAVCVFQNLGNGKFEETLGLSGEVAYKGMPHASWCGVCDFNNDSHQDLFITYAEQPMLVYFNRGFRSFGETPKLEELPEIPDVAQGQQMALIADLCNTGTQELVLVLNNGDIWCETNSLVGNALSVKVRLPAKTPVSGPVSVSLWKDDRCLGAALTQVGCAPAFFGISDAGAYLLKWTLPGGKEMNKKLTVDKSLDVVLDEAN
jgi:hypothetical protein